MIKGEPRLLIEQGEVLWEAMRHSRLSRRDLVSALRLNAQLTAPSQVKSAYIERYGQISAIPVDHEPQVVEDGVNAGVQTIRIELSP